MKVKIIFLGILMAISTLFIVVQQNNKKSQPVFTSAASPIVSEVKAEMPKVMDSPDGSMTLTLDSSLIISSKSDEKKTEIKINSRKLEIPYNTWSPDNVYLFLKETTTNNYLVFQSSGSLFPNNLSYVSINELFTKNLPNYTIEDVTGWAAPNLIIVNTKSNESDQKVSFWFDVPSQTFIQLGTYFK